MRRFGFGSPQVTPSGAYIEGGRETINGSYAFAAISSLAGDDNASARAHSAVVVNLRQTAARTLNAARKIIKDGGATKDESMPLDKRSLRD